MKTDIAGCSTCPKCTEQYETFIMNGKRYYQYDFRAINGELFSCVKPTLDKCREALLAWADKNSERKG